MGPGDPPEARHDALLGEIMAQEGDNVPAFLNTIFGFLSRRCPDEVFGDASGRGGGHITGEHLVSQSFCRWRQRYREERAALQEARMRECDGVPAAVVEEEVVSSDIVEKVEQLEVEEERRQVGNTPSNSSTCVQKRDVKGDSTCGGMDTTNGAVLEGLAWTQGIDDLEVRVMVPPSVSRGKQVRVTVKQTSLTVEVQGAATGVAVGGSSWHTLVDGTMPHPVRAEECLWSLAPAEYVTINLEKCEDQWWDRLLNQHDPIDLGKINAERDYGSLPEEDRSKIQEMMWNKWQADQGKPTSDQLMLGCGGQGAEYEENNRDCGIKTKSRECEISDTDSRGPGVGCGGSTEEYIKPTHSQDSLSFDDLLAPKALGGRSTTPTNDPILSLGNLMPRMWDLNKGGDIDEC